MSTRGLQGAGRVHLIRRAITRSCTVRRVASRLKPMHPIITSPRATEGTKERADQPLRAPESGFDCLHDPRKSGLAFEVLRVTLPRA